MKVVFNNQHPQMIRPNVTQRRRPHHCFCTYSAPGLDQSGIQHTHIKNKLELNQGTHNLQKMDELSDHTIRKESAKSRCYETQRLSDKII